MNDGTPNTGESTTQSGMKKALLYHDKKDAVKSFVTYYAKPIKESHDRAVTSVCPWCLGNFEAVLTTYSDFVTESGHLAHSVPF